MSGVTMQISSRARAVQIEGPGEKYEVDIRLSDRPWEKLCSFLVRSHNGGDRFLVRVKPGNVAGEDPVDVIWSRETYENFLGFVRSTEALE